MALVVSALGGGFLSQLVNRRWRRKDNQARESVAEKELEINAAAAIREELRVEVATLRVQLARSEQDEAEYRTKFFEALGAKQTLETALHTMQPRYIDLIQQNQSLIAENETLKIKAGRRISDNQTETLYRIEQAGIVAAAESAHVADELSRSQGRADAIEGVPGEAADAASKSDNEGRDS